MKGDEIYDSTSLQAARKEKGGKNHSEKVGSERNL